MRLHVVTGKGGTGKTTVAAALALALAEGNRRVLLMEVEGRQGLAQLFDCPPLPYDERRVAVAPGGGEVLALAVDPEAALMDYLEMFYNLRRAGGMLKKLGAIDFATTVAPGIRDVLLTGKAIEAVKRRDHGVPAYDAVVLDAPPTGRITRFLNVNTAVAGLAKVGPIHTQAEAVMAVMRSPRTAVHLVTLLEEMPVQETLDGIDELRATGLPVGAVVINQVRASVLSPQTLDGALDGSLVAAGVAAAGLGGRRAAAETIDALVAEAADHADRLLLQAQERARVVAAGTPVYELPEVTNVDLGALYTLANRLSAQGMT